MTSSVSVVRAWERHVSHTSSPIFTEVSDISAAADSGGRRSAGVSGRRWTGGCGALLVSSSLFGERLRRVARLAWRVRRVSLRGWAQDTLSGVVGSRRIRAEPPAADEALQSGPHK